MPPESSKQSFAGKGWLKIDAKGLGQAAMVPTMLNQEEQSYYLWLMRDWAQGQGAVVDLGSFAGGSAACLAEGIRLAGRNQIVHGYDKYEVLDFSKFQKRWTSYMSQPPASQSGLTPRPLPNHSGEDLRPVVEFLLEPWGANIALHKGLIEDMAWDGGDIEVLIMDASKTAETMDRMSTTFFPYLIPGQSVVVQQDLLHWQQPWIAAQMALLSEHFEPVAYIPRHSVSFLCKKPVTHDQMRTLAVDDMSDKDMIQALRDLKQALKGFPVDKFMRELVAAIKANPQKRKAFEFTNHP
ncbi:hypothetical protein SAMN05444000_11395 [Shimia gijangensis]|uniref:Methyltransferase domain-containing protein n=1 Tax=Shimia gijangensis TaxID=1470563 RepID=A0A1M6MBH7_9RHOB|nr:hypothetical protein [Shimia gijangensis]SHJ80816.1 hypothetical protein SAMN05444000_11395 [Shimia gijangensis]